MGPQENIQGSGPLWVAPRVGLWNVEWHFPEAPESGSGLGAAPKPQDDLSGEGVFSYKRLDWNRDVCQN